MLMMMMMSTIIPRCHDGQWAMGIQVAWLWTYLRKRMGLRTLG